jgi:hypothetical protein
MRTWEEIQKDLDIPPDKSMIQPPNEKAGIFGEYLTAQYVVAELNRIFGVDGWAGRLVKVSRIDRTDGGVVFVGEYTITAYGLDVKGDCHFVDRSDGGVGVAMPIVNKQTGEVFPPKPQALDTAYKAAVSDSLKRAAKSFGMRLGLWLYFDDRALQAMHVQEQEPGVPVATAVATAGKPKTTLEDTGPYIYPGKYKESVSELNKYGKVSARGLVNAIGEDAYGYLKWLWPKMEASEKEWDVATGKELKAWLERNLPNTVAPKATLTSRDDIEKQLKALLSSAAVNDRVTAPIANTLKNYLALAGYADKDGTYNEFQALKRIRASLNDEHATISTLTTKQAVVLAGYAHYILENGQGGKEFAKAILAMAWANNVSWKDACDMYTSLSNEKTNPVVPSPVLDLEAMVKAINPKMSLSDVEPVLVGKYKWPKPLPTEKAAKYFEVCKAKGYTLFNDAAGLLAEAIAQQEGWVVEGNF